MSWIQPANMPPIPPNIAEIAGPPLIGIILNWFFYGILVMQIFVYHQCFPNDKKVIKTIVYGLLVLDTIQSILKTADAFHWFAKGYGNMTMLSEGYLSSLDAPIMDGIIAFVVQSFFCWRIWMLLLQKSYWLPGAVFVIAVASFAGALATGIGAFQVPNLTQLGTLKWQLSLWLGGSALVDTLIAVIMTVLILQARTRHNEQIDGVLVRIITLTIETNAATASVAIVVLVCLLAIPTNPSIAMAPGYALGKLYSNTLLVGFNNRVYMNKQGISRSHSTASIGFHRQYRHSPACAPTSRSLQLESQAEPYRIEVFRKTEVAAHDIQLQDLEKAAPPNRYADHANSEIPL